MKNGTREQKIARLTGELNNLTYPDRLKAAIAKAKETDQRTVIARKQDETDEVVLLEISNCKINDEMDPCYQVSQQNNCIAVAVCSGKKYGGVINYVDL